ncbi:biotin--[acetyl-CoA-carboxylase] ligase [Sphingobacterium rhinopitheci]|uniref:biotin--[acetyl-CoA-carboxylase] ligase n=1 Tax=Sphingobacterium rhinopitheci TaxID=2781960 RepID=UPI001F515BB7|nr:biotin--[acetyl-CoA-carboxylase] ligase [Sphingobacterium rhinopitheci]MCI0921474.1 biotin--[acetyl-CoA-carboxylase] ligase [Sphingobacterium rhinopitheci]
MQNNTFFGYSKPSSLIVLDNVSSTNDYLKQLLANFKPQLPFTAIMARQQTMGRGQRGTSWIAQPNKNLTASFLNTPKHLAIKDQFLTTITSSLAVYDSLSEFIPSNLSIKWPNDIMVNNKKIGGILIENKITSTAIKHSIIGIGINVNTTEFPIEFRKKTTSIALENFDFNLTIISLVKRIQQQLIRYEQIVADGEIDKLWNLYTDRLFRKNCIATYIINNLEIQGEILGVNTDGKLLLKVADEVHKYDLKELRYQL